MIGRYIIYRGVLRYCHYLMPTIGVLSTNIMLSEDIRRLWNSYVPSHTRKNRFKDIYELLYECRFSRGLIEYKCEFVSSEQDICQSLTFDIYLFAQMYWN